MRQMEIDGKSGKCSILIGESISNLSSYCNSEKTVVITDSNVRKLHGKSFPNFKVIEIGLGEEIKTLGTAEMIYKKFLEMELERNSMVIGIGGGIVCDIAGFVSSTYVRGMRLGLVPTTLIAQADAAIGGKNGVNLGGYKNIIGTIRQPEFVLCDFSLLSTLPEKQIRNGFAEIIKHAAIADAKLFSYLEENLRNGIHLKQSAMEKIIHDSILVKTGIVKKDEFEKGERRKLNFGHTVGHAIEKCCSLPHGEAIAIGMVAEANLSVSKGLLGKDDAARIAGILKSIGLSTGINADSALLFDAIKKDKKRKSDSVLIGLLDGIGKCRVQEVPLHELEAILHDLH